MADDDPPPTPGQRRRARELPGRTRAGLGAASGAPTVGPARFEAEVRGPDRATTGAVARALDGAGLDVSRGRASPREGAILPGPVGRTS